MNIVENFLTKCYNNLRINFYHQRGHCSNDLKLAKRDFIKYNNITGIVKDSFIRDITVANDVVDQRSRQIMKTFVRTGYAPYIINNTISPGVNYDISEQDGKLIINNKYKPEDLASIFMK